VRVRLRDVSTPHDTAAAISARGAEIGDAARRIRPLCFRGETRQIKKVLMVGRFSGKNARENQTPVSPWRARRRLSAEPPRRLDVSTHSLSPHFAPGPSRAFFRGLRHARRAHLPLSLLSIFPRAADRAERGRIARGSRGRASIAARIRGGVAAPRSERPRASRAYARASVAQRTSRACCRARASRTPLGPSGLTLRSLAAPHLRSRTRALLPCGRAPIPPSPPALSPHPPRAKKR
jgi:hypothetical protein